MEKYILCESCGALAKVLVPCNCKDCGIKCCNDNMQEVSKEEAQKHMKQEGAEAF